MSTTKLWMCITLILTCIAADIALTRYKVQAEKPSCTAKGGDYDEQNFRCVKLIRLEV